MRFKNFVGTSVTIFWLVMMGLLLYRNRPVESSAGSLIQLERFTKSVHDREWMAIYLESRKIGYAMTSIAKMTDDSTKVTTYSFLQRVFISMRVGNTRQKITLVNTAKANADFGLKSFEASVVSGIHQINIAGEVKDRQLHLILNSSGRQSTQTFDLDEDVQLPLTLEPYLASHGLERGKVYTLKVFDPMTASTSPVQIKVEDEDRLYIENKPYIAKKIKLKYREMESTVWIDYDGRTLKEVSPTGMTMIKVSEENAPRGINPDDDDMVDVLSIYSVIPDQQIEAPRELEQLKIQIEGVFADSLDLDGTNQTLSSTAPLVLEIRQRSLTAVKRLSIAEAGAKADSQWLAATAFIQTTDPAIRQKTQEIVGDETDALRAAIAIQEWLFKNITKQFTLSIPSAVEVLATMEGDCNEHSTLFTALARSAGIPTRICIGLAYVNNGFYYHAWPEVFVGEWLPMDPTFGQNSVDASHIRLLVGDLDQQFNLGHVLGKLKIKLIEMNGRAVAGN